MKEIQFDFDIKAILLRSLYCIPFGLIGLWLAFGDTTILNYVNKLDDQNLKMFLGCFTIFLSIVMLIFLASKAFTKQKGFIIDDLGFEDNTQLIGKSRIFWSQVDSVQQSSVGLSAIAMNAIQINLKDGDKPKYVSAGLLKISDLELFNALQLYYTKTTANHR